MSRIPAAAFSLLYGTDLALTELAFKHLASGNAQLLAVSGKLGSGKDTTAPLVMAGLGTPDALHEFFAKPLKEELTRVIELIRLAEDQDEAVQLITASQRVLEHHARTVTKRLWAEVKSGEVENSYVRTANTRFSLQYWGTDVRREQDDDYWVKKAIGSTIKQLAKGQSIFVTDARFPNEIDALRRAGAAIVRLSITEEEQTRRILARDGILPSDEARRHISETALDNYELEGKFTVVINGDQKLLQTVVNEAIAAIRSEGPTLKPILKHPLDAALSPREFFKNNPQELVSLAVDLDEVCFNYLGGMREFLEGLGYVIPPGKSTSWSLMKSGWVESEDEYKERHAQAVEAGLYTGLELLPGAREILLDLEANGYELNIVTSRFVVPGQNHLVVKQTAKALKRNKLPYANIMFLRSKASFLADAYLDDGPHNIEALRDAGRFVIKMDQVYNEHMTGVSAANLWEAREILRERFGR